MDSENGSAGISGEQELHESLLRQHAILNNIPDIAWLKDRESRFIAVNGPFGAACGVAPADLAGKTDYDIWPRDLAEGYRADDAEVMRTGQRKRVEERLVGPDGRESWIETIKTPILDEHGSVIGTTGIARDITDRKRAEAALAHSRDLMRYVIEHTRSAIAVHDRDLKYIYVSQRYLDEYHVMEKDVIGKHHYEVFPDLPQKWRDVHQRVLGGEVMSAEDDPYYRADGTVDWTRWECRPWYENDGSIGGIIVYTEVITERKRAEEALRKSEERLQFMMSNSPSVIYTCRPAGDFGATFVSSNVVQQLGYAPREFIDDPGFWSAHIHPDDEPRVFDGLAALFAEGSHTHEYRFRHKDGTWRWMHDELKLIRNAAGEPVEIIGSWVDITARKQAEEALQESEEKFRSVFDTASDGILLVDPRTKRFVLGNATIARMLGVGQGDLPNMKVEDVHPAEVLQDVLQTIEKMVPGETPSKENVPLLRKDGSIFLADIATSWITLKGVTYMAGFFRDITERKKAEQERLDLERRLLHSQKLESLGVLAGGIAHDFNNLLMAILGNLDLALRNLSPLSPARVNIEQSAQAARRATDLTRQMLAYSGRGRFLVKAMDLSELVEENAHLLRASVARTATLDLHLDRSLPAIEADSGQVQQVIMNLIINASEAIGECAGRIAVTTGVQQCDETCLKRSRIEDVPPAGRFVYLEVSDTGCGMDEPTQQRLFDPFFSTKAVGRGLGMPAILGIVRGHRGAVFVESSVGAGTTVRILFPAVAGAQAAKDAAAEVRASKTGAPALSGTVLVVDDEEIVRNVCTAMVRAFGMQVLTASDGREAVEVFRQNADRISHVILDLTMPNMDGMAAFKEMVRIRSGVKVILCSGYDEQDSVHRLSGQGLAGFIQKPYTLVKLREALEKAGGAAG